MDQRGVAILAGYLDGRPIGRIVRVRNVGTDDYIVGIDDARDGRTHLIHSVGDLRRWLLSFREGRCLQPAAAICGRCDKVHIDRNVDGELLTNCIGCCAELIAAACS